MEQLYNEYDIAIIGMGCNIPESEDYHLFNENLLNGTDLIKSQSTDEQITVDSSIRAVSSFDAHLFDVPKDEATRMDPQHRKFLECVWSAIEDSGYAPKQLGRKYRVGVFAGCGPSSYLVNNLLPKDSLGNYSYVHSLDGLSDLMSNTLPYASSSITSTGSL